MDLVNVLSNSIISLLEREFATLALYGLANVMVEILPNDKEGLSQDDIKYVIGTMLAQSHVLDMIEALLSLNSRPIKDAAGQIQSKPLILCYGALDIELFHVYQLEMLKFTVLLLIHLENYFGGTSERLRTISTHCITLEVVDNILGCKLMKRIFPKEFFGRQDYALKWNIEGWKR